MLSEKEIIEFKKKIIDQIESTFPEEKKAEAIKQIESMDEESFEEFLKQNNLIKSDNSPQEQQCIFCSIVEGKIPSQKINENEKAIAILEINPISQGHTLIIPRNHISTPEQILKETSSFVENISKKIKENLKPKDIKIFNSNVMGHEIINIVPIYENETENSERKHATPEELEQVKEMLKEKPKPKIIEKKPVKKIDSKNLWLPQRIP